MSLPDLIAILRRRLRLVLLVMALILGCAALYLMQATPRYTATALLLVDPVGQDLLGTETGATGTGQFWATGVEVEVEILQSDAVLLDLVLQMNLTNDPEFGPALTLTDKLRELSGARPREPSGPVLVNQTLGQLRGAIDARRRGLTDLIALSFTSRDPARAAELANALAEVYIVQQVDAKSQGYREATRVLDRQLAAAQAALAGSDAALADYIDQNIDRLARESGSTTIAALRTRLEEANTARLEAEARFGAARASLGSNDWQGLVAAVNAEALRALADQRAELSRRLGDAAAGSVAETDLRAALARVEDDLATEGAAVAAAMRDRLEDATRTGDSLRAELRRELLSGDLSPETLSQLYRLQREATIAQRQYDTLLGRLRDLEAQALLQMAITRIVSPAIQPTEPSYPAHRLVLGLAIVVSAGLGVAIALLNEFYIGGIQSGAQLANSTGAKVASVVPRIHPAIGQNGIADAIIDAPMSAYSESLRRMRASIDRFGRRPAKGGQVVMITSALPVEGKSTTSLALARTCALAGKRTLLIDADMRRPTLHVQLGLEPVAGLFDYLADSREGMVAEDCYAIDPRAPLGVLLGHGPSDAPTDVLFQTERFRALIEDARESFEVVVIDTPPVNPVVDTRYIAALVDCAVLCVRAAETAQSDVRHALEQLADHIPGDVPALTALTFHRDWSRRKRNPYYDRY